MNSRTEDQVGDFFNWVFSYSESSKDAVAYLADWLTKTLRKKSMAFPVVHDMGSAVKYMKDLRAGKAVMSCFYSAWKQWEDYQLRTEKYMDGEELEGVVGHTFETVAFVRRQFDNKIEGTSEYEEDTERLAVHRFVTEPARIEVTMSVTANLGNYESATVKRGIILPCYREEVAVAEKRAEAWVETRINNDINRIRGRNEDVNPEPGLGLSSPRDNDEDILP